MAGTENLTPLSLESMYVDFASQPYTNIESNEFYAVDDDDAAGLRNRTIARVKFTNSTEEWPSLEYPRIDAVHITSAVRQYTGILAKLEGYDAANGESIGSDVLYEQVAIKLAEMYRHLEVLRGVGSLAVNRVEQSRSRAAGMNTEIFGEVDEAMFSTLLAPMITQAQNTLNSADPLKASIASEYLDRLGANAATMLDENIDSPFELTDKTIQTMRADLYEMYPALDTGMQHYAGRLNATRPVKAKAPFRTALGAYDLTSKGWTVKVEKGSRSADAYPDKKVIKFGKNRANFTPESIVMVPVHEATHALMFQNASEQVELHRRLPLPGSFYEGAPVVLEQIISGKKRVPGKPAYIRLGLFEGLHLAPDERHPLSFRQVYELEWRSLAIKSKAPLDEKSIKKYQNQAYSNVLRTARGNAQDNRDILYLEGARRYTSIFNETAQLPPDLRKRRLQWILSGIFDPTNPEHVAGYGGDPVYPNLSA